MNGDGYRPLPFDVEHQRGRLVRRRAWLFVVGLALAIGLMVYVTW